MAIQNALNHVEYGGSKYIAEGTGFFSFLYLLPKPDVNENFNGSCITYSMLELYIMARLHVHANTLTLNMESGHGDRPHGYWKSVQTDEDIKLSSVTHWATQYEFQSYPLYFRSIPKYRGQIKTKHVFNFEDPDKTNLCLLLLYPIFDSYIRYIDQPEAGKKLYPGEIAKILPFIERRIQFVKTLFSHKSEKVVMDETGLPIPGSTSKVDITSIPSGWFKNVFGFDENAANFATTHKDSFHVKKNPKPTESILMTVKGTEIDIGVFRYRSVEELLKVASANPSARSVFGVDSTRNNLKYYIMTSTSRAIHTNPSYHDSIFQVASQFNALEMVNSTTTPQEGITNYVHDKTQGPECAIMCPFGTLYRNYFCMPNASTSQQPEDKSVNGNPQIGTDGKSSGNNQINTLTELMKVDGCFKELRFQNGYIFVNDKDQLESINTYLSNPVNFWNAVMKIKYVIQEDTPVVNVAVDGKIMDHKVSQIYCSAYPVAYDPLKAPEKDYYLLSSMILHAVYYSTLAYAVSRITPDEPRKKVFLTRVGGGVFKNEAYIIDTAIYNAVRHFIAYPIDVYIVGYEKDDEDQAKIIDPKKIDDINLGPTIVTTPPIPDFMRAYSNIQKMLDQKATDEREKVKKATDEMVFKKKEEETKLRSSIKKSTEEEKKEKLDEAKAKLDEDAALDKAKAKSDEEKAALDKAKLEEKAKKKEEDRIHEEKMKKKHLNLTQAIDEAIKTFSEKLAKGGVDDKKYAEILDALMDAINKDREVRAKGLEKSGKKTGKETKSKSKDIIPMNLTGNKSDYPNKDIFIQDLVKSFNAQNAKQPLDRKSKINPSDVEETLNGVYDNGHYMLLNDIHFMNDKTKGLPLIFQLMDQNNLLGTLIIKFDMEDNKVYEAYKTAFDKLSVDLKREYETLCKFLFETKRTSILVHILRIGEDDGEARIFAGIMKGFYDNLLKKEGDARDAILGSVGYTFKSAYGDGNCFYNSAGMQLFDPMTVDKYIEYDKLARNNQWQNTQFEKQTKLRTELTDYLQKLYTKLQSHSNFATSTNSTIKYLHTNGPEFKNVSTILSGIGSQFWGTDDELYFIAALYNCFIVILPSNDTNFQTIEYSEKINSDESNQDKLFKALSNTSIPVLSPVELTKQLTEMNAKGKQIIFMLGGKGHWDYAIPTK
jgi:hypothetical protein